MIHKIVRWRNYDLQILFTEAGTKPAKLLHNLHTALHVAYMKNYPVKYTVFSTYNNRHIFPQG